MKNKLTWQAFKFFWFSASAGIIQTVSFTLLNEILEWNYSASYLIALTLSVLWNFTFNRRFTFKSSANVPIAMAKVFGFYLFFTPVSVWLGEMAAQAGVNKYIILAVTMLCNMVLEFLFCKFVVYRNQEDTLNESAK